MIKFRFIENGNILHFMASARPDHVPSHTPPDSMLLSDGRPPLGKFSVGNSMSEHWMTVTVDGVIAVTHRELLCCETAVIDLDSDVNLWRQGHSIT